VKTKLRIDLTEYKPYIQALQDRLNEDGACKMSMTDAVKIAIEKAVENLLPDVKINKKRKRYIKINF
jgi:exonuclease V gamma subunit